MSALALAAVPGKADIFALLASDARVDRDFQDSSRNGILINEVLGGNQEIIKQVLK